MRKKIQDLAYGKFQYENPMPEFDTERLELELLQGEDYAGSFTVTSVNGIPMRGIVYSSNPRMECQTQQFEGEEAVVEFKFHSEGLVEGDVQKGDFYIAVNGGEYNLSFVTSVSHYYPQASIGKVKNLFDFANLAQVSFEEAYRLYQSPCFENFIKPSEAKEQMLYRALNGTRGSRREMEEFLIGIRKKRKVSFFLEEKEKKYPRLTELLEERIEIRKDNWGYLEIEVRTEGDFLTPQRTMLTPDHFVGNKTELELYIDPDKLHGGKNFGRLILETPYQHEICEILVHQGAQPAPADKEESDSGKSAGLLLPEEEGAGKVLQKRLLCEITKLYLDYRLQRVVTGVWSKESCDRLIQLRDIEPGEPWYPLYQAQALLINKQRQEAEWLLDSFKRNHKEENTPLWGFYLYLCTLRESEPSYISKKVRQIREIYHENQDSLIMFMIMLFVDEELNNSRSRKLSAIEHHVKRYGSSTVLYMEAFYLLSKDVYLLKKADVFEMQVLNWACKNKVLTKETADQVKNLMTQVRYFHPLWYKILKCCYELEPGPEALKVLCGYCIQWSCYGPKYFTWFDLGVKEQLKIAGLYEAWMRSAKSGEMKYLPKTLTMYFQYQNSLDYRQQARLYLNILSSRETQKGLSDDYKKAIEHFALEQLLVGRIDENLAQLYDWMLRDGVKNQEVAKALGTVIYTHKLLCEDENAARVVVIHEQLEEEQVVPILNGQAGIQLYGGSYCILLEDTRGVRYAADMDWQLRRLMQPSHYLKECMKYEPLQLGFLLHYFEGRRTWQTLSPEDMDLLLFLMESGKVSGSYKRELRLLMIEYCYHSYTGEKLDTYLNQVDYEGLDRGSRNKLMELMISRGIRERAYEMLLAFGSEQAAVNKLVFVASQQVEAIAYEKDEFLLGLCHSVFLRGKYNEVLLKYLCSHFTGSVRELGILIKASKEFGLDTYKLEERFLSSLFFTDGYFEDMFGIFIHYSENGGKEMLVLAGLSWFSYQYFVKNALVDKEIFKCMEKQLFLGNELNDCCRLACLRWLTEQKQMSIEEQEWQSRLLHECIKRGMRFAFFQDLPRKLLRKYQLNDKTFVEHRTNPEHRVFLSYGVEDGDQERFVEEELISAYEGIFVKELVIFFGEEIPYYIREESPKGAVVTESGHISGGQNAQEDGSRYDLINGMAMSDCMGDAATLRQLILRYRDLEQTAEQRFTIL